MFPLSEEYLLCPCEVRTLENVPIISGIVSKMLENRFVITNPSEKLPIIRCRTTVKVTLFCSNLELKVLIGLVYLSTERMLLLVDMKTAAEYEKRNSFRIRVMIDTKACLMNADLSEKTPVEIFDIAISNLSLCGAAFKASMRLNIGDIVVIRLTLYDRDILLNSKVKRILTPYSDGIGEYGCIFAEPPVRDCDLISRYIFDCQREQIRAMRQSMY